MTDEISGDVPLMQRLYDKIWLLAVLAFLFWLVTYILWGDLDVFSIPGGGYRMTSPMKPPEGNWWGQSVNRRESIWLGLSGLWSLLIFGWMSGYTRFGDQNPIGETLEVSPEEYQQKMNDYSEKAGETEEGSYRTRAVSVA